MVDKPFDGLNNPLYDLTLSKEQRSQIREFMIALERDSYKGLFAGTCRMFCSGCRVRHPAVAFLERERRKDPRKRVCIRRIGYMGLYVCE